MKLFHCSSCDQLVYFENTQCVNCGSALAYLPEQGEVRALQAAGDGLWTVVNGDGQNHRLCTNYIDFNVCNWTVPTDGIDGFCIACRSDVDCAGFSFYPTCRENYCCDYKSAGYWDCWEY